MGDIGNILGLSRKNKFKDIFIVDSKLSTGDLINTIEHLRSKDFFIHLNDGKFEVLSGINQFEVYGTDDKFRGYKKAESASLNFVSGYLDEETQAYLTGQKLSVKHLDYDWSLNEQ